MTTENVLETKSKNKEIDQLGLLLACEQASPFWDGGSGLSGKPVCRQARASLRNYIPWKSQELDFCRSI